MEDGTSVEINWIDSRIFVMTRTLLITDSLELFAALSQTPWSNCLRLRHQRRIVTLLRNPMMKIAMGKVGAYIQTLLENYVASNSIVLDLQPSTSSAENYVGTKSSVNIFHEGSFKQL